MSQRKHIPPAELFSATEAARILGKSRACLYRMIARKEIATVRDELDHHQKVTGAEIERWADAHSRHVLIAETTPLLERQALAREYGRAGGLTRAANHSREEIAQWFADGRRRAFLRRVDPDGRLPVDELERRMEAAQDAQLAAARAAKIERRLLREQYGKTPHR